MNLCAIIHGMLAISMLRCYRYVYWQRYIVKPVSRFPRNLKHSIPLSLLVSIVIGHLRNNSKYEKVTVYKYTNGSML